MVRHFSIASLLLLLLGSSVSAQPLIRVYEGTSIPPGSTGIPDNTGTVEFGTAKIATVHNKVFTVRNAGNQDLVLAEPINVPNGFTVMRTFGKKVLEPEETTTFVVALNAAAAGRYTGGQISFATNDTPRNPFNFTLTGSALPEAALRIVDNGDTGFRTVGSWQTGLGSDWGYQGNARYKIAGTGSSVVSWTFKGLTPGLYQVSTSYIEWTEWATNAQFTIRDGSTLLTTVTVNQQLPPTDFTDAGVGWRRLSTPVMITGDTLVVQLSDQATAGRYIVADAVRVERAGYVGRIMDDGDTGFTTSGTWLRDTLRGFQVDSLQKAPGAGTATWTFNGLPAGQYRVSATWRPTPTRATNASFQIRDGATVRGTVAVDQRVAPKDISDGGTRWTDLGVVGTVYTTTGTNPLVVVLDAAAANGTVSADAIRVERVNAPVPNQTTMQDVVRLLDQATWGPNSATIATVRSQGISAWVNAQFTATYSGYPTPPIRADDQNRSINAPEYPGCQVTPPPMAANDPTCVREHYTSYLQQRKFFTNAFYEQDQLRQRMAFALHKIVVTDARNARAYAARFTRYLHILDWYSFGNYRDLIYSMTLNPNMADYLDMVRSVRTRPNENYARELLQLFTVGLDELHPDGTPILDLEGNKVPTYTQGTVEQFTKVLTGFVRQPAIASGVSNWIDFMDVQIGQHDLTAKTLLARSPRGRTIPPAPVPTGNEYAWVSLDDLIDNVFYHPNTGPYICKQLIQMLVTSNPTPGYVARVSAVFDRNRTNNNQLREVARAILLDPEARGDIKTDPTYGRLREPVQLVTNMCRAFGATAYHNRAVQSDGVFSDGAGQLSPLDQDVFRPPSVFSYFVPDNVITGTNNVLGPEFQIYSTLSSVRRHNFINLMTQPNNTGGASGTFPPTPAGEVYGIVASPNRPEDTNRPIPNGTKLDLRTLEPMNPTQLMNEIDRVMFGNRMPAALKQQITQAVAVPELASNGLRRAKTAMYLVLNAPEWMVQR